MTIETDSPHCASVLTSWAKAIKKALEVAHCDSRRLFLAAGLDVDLLDDPDARYSLDGTTRLWRLAVDATGDAAFGLKVASQAMPTTFHVVGVSLAASSTLKGAFERIARYSKIVTDVGWMETASCGDEFHVGIHIARNGPPPADEALDAFIALQVRMCRAWLGREASPRRIEFARPAPAPPARAEFERILRCDLHFGAVRNLLVFARSLAERPLDGANHLLVQHFDDIALHYLARFDCNSLLTRVRSELIKRLPQGEPSQDDIAAAFHLGARSLQRKLAEHGATYKGVLDATRHALALSYLTRFSATETTYLLGFAETSSFTRAFKRWTGLSPSEFRKRSGTAEISNRR